jgi:hypothetical protein
MIPVHSPSPVELDRRRLDTKEAPEGFRAWLKYDVSGGENICRKCNYREKCLTVPGKCRADQRKDNCSVFYIDETRFN